MENKEAQTEIKKVEHKNIYEAISALQGELKPIERSGKVSFKMKNKDEKVEFNYAPLEKIGESIYPLLAKHGLSYRHHLNSEGIECIVTHETYTSSDSSKSIIKRTTYPNGQVDEIITPSNVEAGVIYSGRLPIDTKNADMKEVGGQITYGRRYTLGLALGIVTEEDKDAQMLAEKGQENLKKFAFQKAKEAVEKANAETIDAQLELLTKDRELAKAVVEGTGKKAPLLGLNVEEYDVLIKMATERKVALGNKDDIKVEPDKQ